MKSHGLTVMVREWAVCSGLVVILLMAVNPVFGQTDVQTGKQVTLSDDLANNPVAQDILKKIEQTKQWIAELEQRDYEKLAAQKELEAKRAEALEKLNQDLAEWEQLWEYYSPRNSFERFVDGIAVSEVKDVFWDQFEFHELKVQAGRAALKEVIANGGSLQAARQAYLSAAETKRIELIEANSMFNVNHNLAYYNQQILFNREGQYVDTPVTGEQLRKYYEDYRTNPAYLAANPNDAVSWEELGQTSPDTDCREGYVVVYRFHAQDYVCVTTSTAEMWIRHGMGEIPGMDSSGTQEKSVTPLTKCDEGFVIVQTTETGKYSCVMDETAQKWIQDGVASIPNPEDYIMKRIESKEATLKIQDINQKIREFGLEFQQKQADLKIEFDKKYADALEQSKQDEKKATKDYNERPGMSKEELSTKIMSIRKNHESTQDDILQEKTDAMNRLENSYRLQVKNYVDGFQFEQDIKIVWNSAMANYEATKP